MGRRLLNPFCSIDLRNCGSLTRVWEQRCSQNHLQFLIYITTFTEFFGGRVQHKKWSVVTNHKKPVELVTWSSFSEGRLLESKDEKSHRKGKDINLFWDVRTLIFILSSLKHFRWPILICTTYSCSLLIQWSSLSKINKSKGKIFLDHNVIRFDVSMSKFLDCVHLHDSFNNLPCEIFDEIVWNSLSYLDGIHYQIA